MKYGDILVFLAKNFLFLSSFFKMCTEKVGIRQNFFFNYRKMEILFFDLYF